MKAEQLKIDLINHNDDSQDLDDVEPEFDNTDNLLYKNKLKQIIYDIGRYEGIDGIRISNEGQERIQQNSKYIISILIFEIVEELKRTGRKTISSDDADRALDRVLNKVGSIDHTIMMLKEDINKLEKIRNNSVANKVNKFINNI